MMTSMRARDVAKFFAGWSAAETVGHWIVGILGKDMFPVIIGSFTFTSGWNTFAMVFWPIVLVASVHLGWIHKQRTDLRPIPPTHAAPA